MGLQNAYLKIEQISDDSIGNEGQDLRNYFNIPDEDDEQDYNEIIEVIGNSGSNPIAKIDDAIKALQDAKDKGANFVAIWEHEDHQEIHIEGYKIEKLTDEEVLEYKAEEQKKELKRLKRIEDSAREQYNKLKEKYG